MKQKIIKYMEKPLLLIHNPNIAPIISPAPISALISDM